MAPPPEKGTYYAHPLPPLSLDCSFIFIIFSERAARGEGGALPDFFFFLVFPIQQTTSGIGHRVK